MANIFDKQPPASDLLKPAGPSRVNPAELRDLDDFETTRSAIYDSVLDAAANIQPVTNKTHSLSLENVRYVDPDNFSKRRQKEATLTGQTLARRLKGEWVLRDVAGNEVERRDQVVMKVPHLTQLGTFIHNGSQYAVRNQQRLRAGMYSRQKENGLNETFVNVLEGGPTHRYSLDPDKELFYVHLDQAKIPLFPLLESLGATDKELSEAFGPKLFQQNKKKSDKVMLMKLVSKLLPNAEIEGADIKSLVREKFEGMRIDPGVSKRTLGQPYDRLNKDAVLSAAKKLLAINRGESEYDNRDEPANQTFHGVEDLFSERIRKDRAGLLRQLLFKTSIKNNLKNMPSSALQDYVESVLIGSGLGLNLEQISPAEMLDKATQITRTGEGGMGRDAAPDSARNVFASQYGFMSAFKTPESSSAGLDVHMGLGVKKGRDGQIYRAFKNPKTGEEEWLSPADVRDSVIGFSNFETKNDDYVYAVVGGELDEVPKSKVDYYVGDEDTTFSPLEAMVPWRSMIKGQRLSMGARMIAQALPLVNAEAPLVQAAIKGTNGERSYEDKYGRQMGAIRAKQGGRVLSVDEDSVKVRYDDGTEAELDLFRNAPFNRKSAIHQVPMVEPGDVFKPDQLLVKSNFTDNNGTTALGVNARVAYVPWDRNYEDAIVISESMADRLTSSHMYQNKLDVSPRTEVGKKSYLQHFAGKYDKDTLAKFDDTGAIKVGQEVNYGDPLVLAIEARPTTHGKVHRKRQSAVTDQSITWKKKDPGVVTDVFHSKSGPVVVVKSSMRMRVGDKLSGRVGGKGVIGDIIPDDKMPKDKDGKPFEVLLNPLGTISRGNPFQDAEAALGKLARKLGKPIKVEDFQDKDFAAEVRSMLKKHGLSAYEDIIDPRTGRKIRSIKTGDRFFMKLHHQSESKGSARAGGAYTQDGEPAKGKFGKAKRRALLDTNALLSHGAIEVIRDGKIVSGQQNEEGWLQFMNGYKPKWDKVPTVYKKMVAEMKAAGINVVEKDEKMNMMALTNDAVRELAGKRRVSSGETVHFDKDLKPVAGGLFDDKIFGDRNDGRWAAIDLPVPIPNPVMEEPIRRLLDLTKKEFEAVIAGEREIPEHGTGPRAIKQALESINVDRELARTRQAVKGRSKTKRDIAVRKLGYLKSMKRMGLNPADYMLDMVPVLPPQFRPVSVMGGNSVPLVADANMLYRELIDASNNYKELKDQVGDEGLGDEALSIYKAFQGVTGLGDPITKKNQERNVRGILKRVLGSSPKHGTLQRKLIGTTLDNTGRGVITPNPDFDMDTVGIPESKAFEVYSRFVVRRLRRRGMPLRRAMEEVNNKTPLAREMLQAELNDRPVILNRAPVLHRYGILALRPRLVKGETIQMSPLIYGGLGADNDGDTVNYHVPTSDEAVEEAYQKMLPSRSLISPQDFKSPVHNLTQEFVAGVFNATNEKSRRRPHVFKTKRDAILAYRRGDIAYDDNVKILEP